MLDRLRTARQDEGFTLIELLIVIIILGILAAIVVFAIGGISDRGTKSACKSDYKTVQTAEEAYYAKFSAYGTLAQLQAANYIKDQPSNANYTITVDSTTGVVTATGLAGCP